MKKFYKKIPYIGETRIKTFFAILPVFAENGWAWLEKVTVEQMYYRKDDLLSIPVLDWHDVLLKICTFINIYSYFCPFY